MKTSEETLRNRLLLCEPGGDKNFSVQAGAGAGKTTLLSKRIAREIGQGHDPNSFAIITYTKAAAEELREKVASELLKLSTSGNTEAIKNRAFQAYQKIALLQISTIHSFLLQILREYAFEANIALDAELLEEDDETARQKKFFDQWYEEHRCTDHLKMEQFIQDWTTTTKKGKEADYHRQALEGTFCSIAALREKIVLDDVDLKADYNQKAQDYLNTYLDAFVRLKDAILDPNNIPTYKTNGKKAPFSKLCTEMCDLIETADKDRTNPLPAALLLSKAFSKFVEKSNDGKSFYQRQKDDGSAVIATYPAKPKREVEWSFEKALQTHRANQLAEYALGIQWDYQQKIDGEARFLSNDDILYRADKLLANYPDILEKVRKRYTKLYVDEFQDTTLLQARVVNKIAGGDGNIADASGLNNQTLCTVGDPKQSIYRFSGAEKAVYDTFDNAFKIASAKGKCEAVRLESNFRSNSDIVEWVNNHFSVTMGMDYAPMVSERTVKDKGAVHGVYQYQMGSPNKETEPQEVAVLVQKLTSGAYYLEEGEKKRPVQYSDFMILTRKTSDMDLFVDSFSKAGIPVQLNGKYTIKNDPVIENFISLVRFMARPKNGQDKMQAVQTFSGLFISRDNDDDVADAEEKLWNLRKELTDGSLDSAAIIRRLQNREDLFLPVGNFDQQRVRQYRARLNQMIEAVLADNDGDLAAIAEQMEQYREKKLKRENGLVNGENAVRLMNVHKAKGLTGNIVIIANRRNEENVHFNGFKKQGVYYPAVSYTYYEEGESTPVIIPTYAFDYALADYEEEEEKKEKVRLEYVAATRAAHALIFMPAFGRAKNPWFSDPAYDVENLPDFKAWMDSATGTPAVSPVSKATGSTLTWDDLSNSLKGYSKTPLVELVVSPSLLEGKGITGYSHEESGYEEETDRPRSDHFGTVLHRVFELAVLDFEALATMDDTSRTSSFEAIIRRAIMEQQAEDWYATKDDEALYKSYLGKILPDYFERILKPICENAQAVYPEFTFDYLVPAAEKDDFVNRFLRKEPNACAAEKIRVSGQADLVVKQKDGTIKVYDYKSDARSGKPLLDFEVSLKNKYTPQLELYKYVLGKAFGVDNVDTELIHLYR